MWLHPCSDQIGWAGALALRGYAEASGGTKGLIKIAQMIISQCIQISPKAHPWLKSSLGICVFGNRQILLPLRWHWIPKIKMSLKTQWQSVEVDVDRDCGAILHKHR